MKAFFYNRKFIISILFLFLNLMFNSCYSQREVTLENDQPIKIYKIELLNNEIIEFEHNQVGYAVLSGSKIIGKEKNGENKIYQVSEVKKMYTEKFDYVKTFLTIAWSTAVLTVVFLALLFKGKPGGFAG